MNHAFPMPAHCDLDLEADHVSLTFRLGEDAERALTDHIPHLRYCVAAARQRIGFEVEAAAILPDRMYLLVSMADASAAQGLARIICRSVTSHAGDSTFALVCAQDDLLQVSPALAPLRRSHIEMAPVRAGLVEDAMDWPHSSAHARVADVSHLGVRVA